VGTQVKQPFSLATAHPRCTRLSFGRRAYAMAMTVTASRRARPASTRCVLFNRALLVALARADL